MSEHTAKAIEGVAVCALAGFAMLLMMKPRITIYTRK